MQEEIFGPAIILLPYDQTEEVIADINSRPKPLALYYFGTDAAEQEAVLTRTFSGGVTVNDIMMHPGMHDAPFGGVGASGMGHYHGREGFLEFSHARTVFEAPEHDPRADGARCHRTVRASSPRWRRRSPRSGDIADQ